MMINGGHRKIFVPVCSFFSSLPVGILLFAVCTTLIAGDPASEGPNNENVPSGVLPIQVDILSRGRGVPEEAIRAYQEIQSLAEQQSNLGTSLVIQQTTLGIEGERRMCIVIDDEAQASVLFEDISVLAMDIELMRVSRELCYTAAND